MKLAPLQLLDYWVERLHMDANEHYNSNKEVDIYKDSLDISHDVSRLKQDNDPEMVGTSWIVTIQLTQSVSKDKNIPYAFDLIMRGIVAAHPDLKEEKLHRVIEANAPAMLFGSAREVIRAATGRGPHAPVIIPSTNFLDSKAPAKKSAKKSAKKTAKKKSSKKTKDK